MSFAATQKPIETTNEAETEFFSGETESETHSGNCDLCGKPLNTGERYTHKDCADYENLGWGSSAQ